ncbi:MAG TPA: ribonuclease H-like domain-containing protein [Pseudobacteroides sp.]|uniref:ribonuclease H-like domain-containing protein n=1 Tax=Pseudobacteroides sp. TaxID=1968840 RepID=UPI002F941891
MYSDLRSKLKQFAEKQNTSEAVKIETNAEIDRLMEGTIESNGMGSFFMHKNTYSMDCVHGNCTLGDFAALDFDYLLKVFSSNVSKLELKDMVFLDTETTGLGGSGTVAFLIGIGYFEEDNFVVKQLFMRDYDEEPAMLCYLDNELAGRKGLITFNGKAFDWNLLNSRFIFNRIKCRQTDPVHLDLLHISRAIWKRKLESCRLISLEENLLDFKRADDIPGYLIPSAYFKYVNDRDASDMKRVLEHNRLDIISMVSLSVKISKLLNNPLEEASDYNEVFGTARIYNRVMDYGKAESCFKHCSVSNNNIIRVEALKELTGLYKNNKDYDGITKCLELIMSTSKTPNIPVMIELAKHYEHRVKDINNAKSITEKAFEICLGNSLLRGVYYKDLKHRLDRLIRKAANKAKV